MTSKYNKGNAFNRQKYLVNKLLKRKYLLRKIISIQISNEPVSAFFYQKLVRSLET